MYNNLKIIYKQLYKEYYNRGFYLPITIYYNNKVLDSRIINFKIENNKLFIQTTAYIMIANLYQNSFINLNKPICKNTIKIPINGFIKEYDENKEIYYTYNTSFYFKIQ